MDAYDWILVGGVLYTAIGSPPWGSERWPGTG